MFIKFYLFYFVYIKFQTNLIKNIFVCSKKSFFSNLGTDIEKKKGGKIWFVGMLIFLITFKKTLLFLKDAFKSFMDSLIILLSNSSDFRVGKPIVEGTGCKGLVCFMSFHQAIG